MSQTQENRGDQFVEHFFPAEATAGSIDEVCVFQFPYNATITAAQWIPAAAVTGAATNNFALAVNNLTAAATVTTAKTYASGTNSVANVAEALTVTGGTVTAGDVVTFKRSINGTGLASPNGSVRLTYRWR